MQHDLRANRTARIENLKRRAQFERLCIDDPDFAAALEFADPHCNDFAPFIADVTDTVRRTGRISDNQRDAVLQGQRGAGSGRRSGPHGRHAEDPCAGGKQQ